MSTRLVIATPIIAAGLAAGFWYSISVDRNDARLELPWQADGRNENITAVGVVDTFSCSAAATRSGVDVRSADDSMLLSPSARRYVKDEMMRMTFLEEKGRQEFVDAMRQILSDEYGHREANFYADLIAAEDWLSAKELIENRTS